MQGLHPFVALCCVCASILQAKLSSLGRLEDRLDIKLAVTADLPGQLEGLARQQRSEAAGMEGLRAEVRSLQAQLGRLERGAALAKSEAAVAPLNPTQLSHVSTVSSQPDILHADDGSGSGGSLSKQCMYKHTQQQWQLEAQTQILLTSS